MRTLAPIRRLGVLVLLLATGYALSPYLALAWLVAAASSDDPEAFVSAVDRDALRESLERQLALRLAEGDRLSESRLTLARSLAEQLAHPETLRAFLQNDGRLPPLHDVAAEGADVHAELEGLDWMFFTAPTRFEVRGDRGALVLAVQGGWWRLVDLRLPDARPPDARSDTRVPVSSAERLRTP